MESIFFASHRRCFFAFDVYLPQCDQMARYSFEYLAICKNENIAIIATKVGQIRFKRFRILTNPKKLPKTFKNWPKRWNFAKSGHNGLPSSQIWEGKIFATKLYVLVGREPRSSGYCMRLAI